MKQAAKERNKVEKTVAGSLRRTSLNSTINGEAVGFPGIGDSIDCPFNVSADIPLAGALREADVLLTAAWGILLKQADEQDSYELRGCAHLVMSASALITSLSRGFDGHPLSQGDDGYHIGGNAPSAVSL